MNQSSIRAKQYRRCDKTIKCQEKLKIIDQQGGGALKVWDRKMQKGLDDERK
jgi:hypothetical protein